MCRDSSVSALNDIMHAMLCLQGETLGQRCERYCNIKWNGIGRLSERYFFRFVQGGEGHKKACGQKGMSCCPTWEELRLNARFETLCWRRGRQKPPENRYWWSYPTGQGGFSILRILLLLVICAATHYTYTILLYFVFSICHRFIPQRLHSDLL